jgi:hypothetical protein
MRASFFDEPLQCQGTLTGSPLPYLTPLYFTRANTATRARLYVRRATPEDCESDTTPARRTWRKRDKNSGAVSALSDEVLCFAVIGVGLVSDLARHGARNGAGITGGQPGFRFGGTLMNTSPPFPLGFGAESDAETSAVDARSRLRPGQTNHLGDGDGCAGGDRDRPRDSARLREDSRSEKRSARERDQDRDDGSARHRDSDSKRSP